MADQLHDDVFDNGLNVVKNNTENLYLLNADPGLTWANIAAYAVGVKAAPSISSPADRTGGGRKVTVSAITDGEVTVTDPAASYFALTDDSATKILVSGDLTAPQAVTDGNVFTLNAFDVGIPDPD